MSVKFPQGNGWRFTADGTGDWLAVNATQPIEIEVASNGANAFGGGTVALYYKNAFGDAVAMKDASGNAVTYTEDGLATYQFSQGREVRPVLSGATSPDIKVTMKQAVTA